MLGTSHEQRSLAGYSPWGSKESDKTEPLSTYIQVQDIILIRVCNFLRINCLMPWKKTWNNEHMVYVITFDPLQ